MGKDGLGRVGGLVGKKLVDRAGGQAGLADGGGWERGVDALAKK